MIDFSNAEGALDYILELIALDEESLDRLPGTMKERAMWARAALAEGDSAIDFGRYGNAEGYTFAARNPEDDRWYDIAGHYHSSSPSDSLRKQNERAQKRKSWLWNTQQVVKEIRTGGSLSTDDFTLRELSDIYYSRRKRVHQDTCSMCGKAPKRLIWHHKDTSILPRLHQAESDYKTAKDLALFRKAYIEYIEWGKKYYLCPISETAQICDSCHRGIHKRNKHEL